MKERPILFSGAMVRALLADTKTQTRRIVKPQPTGLLMDAEWNRLKAHPEMPNPVHKFFSGSYSDASFCAYSIPCPYGKSGDRLWVRETWRYYGGPEFEYQRDKDMVIYRATHDHDHGYIGESNGKSWKPSIFMPRWASRITLEVVNVRVERLQDISEEDAIAEGIERIGGYTSCSPWRDYSKEQKFKFFSAPSASYRTLWESINGKGSWDANPYVWVIEFRKAMP